MRKISKLMAAAAVAAAIGGGGVIAAAPASASSDCAAGYACAWEHANYNPGNVGKKVSFQYGIPDMRNFGFDDMASSLKNSGRTSNAAWSQDLNYTGRTWVLNRGYVSSDLAGSWLQDSITSARFI
ncbi:MULTISPECIES: peptidase inhibitor family I36 protein [Oerskovia]|uniref:Peptidase inhibitor family I36 protein n=1 Tax=Oerskovia gallyi TaxID=2762226 RepID=A0ABR8V6L2_9CELL|nr:peptidase inhibitor family I36 protein [Oerskovia gallyi]MBD8000420.1 peptidase inhibitor family I36 protein [Oerskovia gallyi]